MKDFYFKDKNTNVAYRGYQPTNDRDCPPFDYFRLNHAYYSANLFQDVLKVKCPIPIPDDMVRRFVLEQLDESISEVMKKTMPNPAIHQLFANSEISYREQTKLLRDVALTFPDLLWLNREAQDMGYLLDIYHEEKYPEKFKEKSHPILIVENEDGDIEKMGETDMTDGEMKSLLQQRKVIQARIYHKENIWHCFYFTFKGLAGEESGLMGSKPHYHYLSDKSGITWDTLITRIKDCDMPTSKVHIIIQR